MFAGTLYRTVDVKGRLVIPESFRRRFGGELVLTYGAEGCLFALPNHQWEQLADRHHDDRDFGLLFTSGATVLKIDAGTGRVLIPSSLREWAGLRPGVEVALAGIGAAVAIAPSGQWNSLVRQTEKRLVEELIGGPVRTLPPLWSDLVTGQRTAPVG